MLLEHRSEVASALAFHELYDDRSRLCTAAVTAMNEMGFCRLGCDRGWVCFLVLDRFVFLITGFFPTNNNELVYFSIFFPTGSRRGFLPREPFLCYSCSTVKMLYSVKCRSRSSACMLAHAWELTFWLQLVACCTVDEVGSLAGGDRVAFAKPLSERFVCFKAPTFTDYLMTLRCLGRRCLLVDAAAEYVTVVCRSSKIGSALSALDPSDGGFSFIFFWPKDIYIESFPSTFISC